jgi:hypothetical protein
MSTDGIAYVEQSPAPRRREPAFGDLGPPPEVETERETHGPLDRRTEAILGLGIVTSVLATYSAIGYGLYALVSSAV